MKKIYSFLAIAVSAAFMASCNKYALPAGEESKDRTPMLLAGEIEHNEEDTKVVQAGKNSTGTNYIYHWTDGDAISLYTWTASNASDIHDHGKFQEIGISTYTSTSGDVYSRTTFAGYVLNEGLKDTKGRAIYPYTENRKVELGANPKFYVDLPVEQDGTGAKYIIGFMGTKPTVFEDPLVIGAMTIVSSFVKITVPAEYLTSRITAIRLEVNALGSAGNQAFVAGDENTVFVQGAAMYGGNSNSVKVVKTDGFITGDVYFAIRPLTNTNFLPMNLNLIFTTKDGKIARASTQLDKVLAGGKVYDFGTVSGLSFETGEDIPHVHNLVYNEGQEPTEDEAGWLGFYSCSEANNACNWYWEDAEGQRFIGGDDALLAWLSEGGKGYLEPVKAHTHTIVKVEGQAPTALDAGWKEYYECSSDYKACGLYWEDAEGTVLIGDAIALAAWKSPSGNGYIAPLGGGDKEYRALDLNWIVGGNTVMYYKDKDGNKLALPTQNNINAENLYYDQDGTTYVFRVNEPGVGGWYYFSKTSSNNTCCGLFLNQGKTPLELPLIDGFKLVKVKACHGKDATADNILLISTEKGTDATKITTGQTWSIPYAKGGELGEVLVENADDKTPMYLYGKNGTSIWSNTTVLARLVLVYEKI